MRKASLTPEQQHAWNDFLFVFMQREYSDKVRRLTVDGKREPSGNTEENGGGVGDSIQGSGVEN